MSNSRIKNTYLVRFELRKNFKMLSLDPYFFEENEIGDIISLFPPYVLTVRAFNIHVAKHIAWETFKWDTRTYMPRTMFKITAYKEVDDNDLPF